MTSTFGGPVPTPHLQKLADNGLKYNRFHTTALCSPTRAAILNGRNHHSVGTGVIIEMGTGYPGYTGVIPRSAALVSETLKDNGYATGLFGKWHNTPEPQISPAGPFDRWPTGLGFDYFYGFNQGETHQYYPVIYRNTSWVPQPKSPEQGYHFTTDMTDEAITWTRNVRAADRDKPWFSYFSSSGVHAPHHPPKEYREKYRGKFDHGWDEQRELTHAKQLEMGVIPPGTKLTSRPDSIPSWESRSADEKTVYTRLMENYVGYMELTDAEVGRYIESLRQAGELDNTLVMYVVGDNGASAEGGLEGSLNENLFFNGFPEKWEDNLKHIDEIGGPKWFNHFPSAWAHAMNTPFQWTKQVASHFGGTRNPMVISWPAKIKDKGGIRSQFLHVIDIVPTLYDAIGITPPMTLNGAEQKPIEGASFLKTFDGKDIPEPRRTQYFEMLVNRGMYHDGWMASSRSFVPWVPIRGEFDPLIAKWELYDVNKDFSQAENVAAAHPEKVKELETLFWQEAERYKVLPLDWRAVERLNAELQGRPSLAGNRDKYVYYPGQVALPDGASPPVLNKSFTVTADLEVPEAGAEGMVYTHGGLTGGYGLYLRDGRAHFVYNMLAVDRFTITSEKLPQGKLALAARFACEGKPGESGKPATVTLTANGVEVGNGRLPRTVPIQFSLGEGVDVGMDTGSGVDFTYDLPFKFTGTIHQVTVELK